MVNETDEEEKLKRENLEKNWKLLENILLEVQNATKCSLVKRWYFDFLCQEKKWNLSVTYRWASKFPLECDGNKTVTLFMEIKLFIGKQARKNFYILSGIKSDSFNKI